MATPARVIIEKTKSWSNLCTFRTTSKPPISTKGSSESVPPTHQLAYVPNTMPVTATASATGLKICFLSMVRIYFEAIATMLASTKIPAPIKSLNETGFKISTKINAVI